MEVKKSPKADLEKGKTLGVLMGMIVGLAVLFVGFEWSDREVTIVQSGGVADIIAEEEVEITRPEDTPPPPPPPPAPAIAEELNVVEDECRSPRRAPRFVRDRSPRRVRCCLRR